MISIQLFRERLSEKALATIPKGIVGGFKVTRPSFFGGYHPTLKLSGIPTFTFIVSLTHKIDNI